ncbi:MAG TPA: ATP-binding protein [Opitutaceae bacterium]|nr:ATP-binding protein [Opitutaceae bacterium]
MKRWWERRTLRFRLALWYAVGGSVLLAGFSATLYKYVDRRLALPLDYQLRRDLKVIEHNLAISAKGHVTWDGHELPDRSGWSANNPWFELWDDHGRLVARMWPFTDDRVEQMPAPPVRGRETLSVFNVAQDLRLRVLSVPYDMPGTTPDWMIRVMRVHEPAADALGALRLIIFAALPIVVALLVVGGYVLTRRWLSPLDEMVEEANRITAHDLGRRLPVTNPYDELGRLATVFNVTLDRLEGSFSALSRFVADASHELRTPLTTLRSVGEVGLRRSRTVEQYHEIIGSMLEEAQRLQQLVQRLLELASAEGGAAVLHRAELRIDEFVGGCVAELSILAEAKRQQLVLDTVPCTSFTDAVILRQALQNLIDNAIKYSPEGTTIRVTVRQSESMVSVAVADEGPGISPQHRSHLMERFFRPDRARGRGKGGFGLGLSITKAYMRVLGGALDYEALQPNGSVFILTLPTA